MMKDNQKQIALKFDCQEKPESFSKSENGEFCSACQKEVIDFTTMSFSQIQRIRSSQSEMCGKFRAEQIDPTLHPINLPKARSLAFLSTVLVSLNFGNAAAQSTVDPKIEQSQGSSNAPNLTPEEAKKKAESGQHISLSRAEAPEPVSDKAKKETPQQKAKRNKKWFWSKRFPFLHRKRRHYRGVPAYR